MPQPVFGQAAEVTYIVELFAEAEFARSMQPVAELDRHFPHALTAALDDQLQTDFVADWIQFVLFVRAAERGPPQREETSHRIGRPRERTGHQGGRFRVQPAGDTPIFIRAAAWYITAA